MTRKIEGYSGPLGETIIERTRGALDQAMIDYLKLKAGVNALGVGRGDRASLVRRMDQARGKVRGLAVGYALMVGGSGPVMEEEMVKVEHDARERVTA